MTLTTVVNHNYMTTLILITGQTLQYFFVLFFKALWQPSNKSKVLPLEHWHTRSLRTILHININSQLMDHTGFTTRNNTLRFPTRLPPLFITSVETRDKTTDLLSSKLIPIYRLNTCETLVVTVYSLLHEEGIKNKKQKIFLLVHLHCKNHNWYIDNCNRTIFFPWTLLKRKLHNATMPKSPTINRIAICITLSRCVTSNSKLWSI